MFVNSTVGMLANCAYVQMTLVLQVVFMFTLGSSIEYSAYTVLQSALMSVKLNSSTYWLF